MTELSTPSRDLKAQSTGLGALLEAMRIPHWIKNAFVAAPILFSRRYGELWAWQNMLAALLAFGLLSSAGYLVNDVHDRAFDRAHPTKRHRPIASGRLGAGAAMAAAVVLMLIGLAIAAAVGAGTYDRSAALLGLGLPLWAGAYVAVNLLYTYWLKKRVILDVVVVAMLFVLRAMAGAGAVAVAISPWLVVCTFTLCLYIALTKRRSEVVELPAGQAAAARAVNRAYRRRDIEHMLTVSTALAILTYSLYCLAPSTIAHAGSPNMVWTIPLVVYGMFRYNVITRLAGRNDPVKVLLTDRAMWAVLALYVLLAAAVLQYGRAEAVRSILEMPH